MVHRRRRCKSKLKPVLARWFPRTDCDRYRRICYDFRFSYGTFCLRHSRVLALGWKYCPSTKLFFMVHFQRLDGLGHPHLCQACSTSRPSPCHYFRTHERPLHCRTDCSRNLKGITPDNRFFFSTRFPTHAPAFAPWKESAFFETRRIQRPLSDLEFLHTTLS